MIRNAILAALALAGLGFGVFMVVETRDRAKPTPPAAAPPTSPFETTIAAAGVVETPLEDIAVAAPVTEVVREVAVEEGDEVEAGDLLFRLDGRVLEAGVEAARARLERRRREVERLKAEPRPERLPVAEARLARARADLREAERSLERAADLLERDVVSQADYDASLERKQQAAARVDEAEAELALLKAGAWEPDVAVAGAAARVAEAEVAELEARIDERSVRAPVAGTVLRVNVAPGELARAGRGGGQPQQDPLIVLGATRDRLFLRVDVDEHDVWRFRPGGRAQAVVRGNAKLTAELRFESLEPKLVPKRSLTGKNRERTDTRVLQAIYSFDADALPVYVGQQLDVFIEAAEAPEAPAADAATKPPAPPAAGGSS